MVTHNPHHRDAKHAAQNDPAQNAAFAQTLSNSINAMNVLGNQSAPAPTSVTGNNINTSA